MTQWLCASILVAFVELAAWHSLAPTVHRVNGGTVAACDWTDENGVCFEDNGEIQVIIEEGRYTTH